MTGRSLPWVALLFPSLLLLGVVPDRGTAQAIPFHTPTALPLALEESAPRILVQRVRLGSLVGPNLSGPDEAVPRLTTDVGALMVPYAFRRGTFVMVGIPYVRKTFQRPGIEDVRETNSGLGDLSLLVRQELLARDFIGGNRRLALFLGATLPTGETRADGEVLEVPLRLGSGVVRLRARSGYSHVGPRFGFHGATGYGVSVGSAFGARPGDEWTYDLAAGYRMRPGEFETLREPTLGAYLEVNGAYERPATRDGEPVPDTGGHLIFLPPGVQFIPRPNLAIEASVQAPIIRRPRGTQLMPDWTVAASLRAILDLFPR